MDVFNEITQLEGRFLDLRKPSLQCSESPLLLGLLAVLSDAGA